MEMTDEKCMNTETEQASNKVFKEARPAEAPDETLEEFIGYLMDLDLRF